MTTAKKKSPVKATKAAVPPSKVYLLRTSDKDGKSHGGFQWPKEGYVEAPDWNPEPTCGGGLHGLPWGDGGWELLDATDYTRIWQVLEADAQDVVSIDGRKSKARCGNVIYSGNMADAMAKVLACQWRIDEIVAVALADKAANTSSGNSSTAASSGDSSKAASSGDNTITMAAGTGCIVQAGNNGCFASCYYDEKLNRNRILIGYVGEDGILPDTPYTIVAGAWKAVGQ